MLDFRTIWEIYVDKERIFEIRINSRKLKAGQPLQVSGIPDSSGPGEHN